MKNERGFLLPVVLFALMIMGTMAVVAINVSVLDHRSSRAIRQSGVAFHAALYGADLTRATWTGWDTLTSGNIIDLGWDTLANGSSYRATIMRVDPDLDCVFLPAPAGRTCAKKSVDSIYNQQWMYLLKSEGRDVSGASRSVGYILTLDGTDSTMTEARLLQRRAFSEPIR